MNIDQTALAEHPRVHPTAQPAPPLTLPESLRDKPGYPACLMPLLTALDWRGVQRELAEALPHLSDDLDLIDFRNTLANLNFASELVRAPLHRLDRRLMPCLFVPDGEGPRVLIDMEGGQVTYFDPATGETRSEPSSGVRGSAYCFRANSQEYLTNPAQEVDQAWFDRFLVRFRPTWRSLLGITLLLNLLGLAVPLFIMMVYDRVVASGSIPTLVYLGIGIATALAFEFALRSIRVRLLAYVGARMDTLINTSVFRRILSLPPIFTEGATIGAQVARMKEFEAIRDFFTSPLALVFLEIPFVILFIAVIAVLAGPLALVPVVLIAMFALAIAVFNPIMRKLVAKASRATAARQSFYVEMLSKLRTIKYGRSERTWLERHRTYSADAATASFQTAMLTTLIQTTGHILMLCAGVAMLGFGALRVLDGAMTVGALVASMALTWRVLSPLQSCFLTFAKLEQVRNGIRQLNNLMRLQPERAAGSASTAAMRVDGRVTLSRVSLRYAADAQPALIGVSLEVQPGEVVAVIGRNGSGKTSLFNLILGLYHPQVGSVRIDGHDIRQLDPVAFRQSIAYMPQHSQLFHGTIAQNLRLAEPGASDEDLRQAAERAHVLDDILAFPQGFDTRVSDQAVQNMSAGFRQRLALARVYLKNAQLVLMDEPSTALDDRGDAAFRAQVNRLRRHSTVFFVTHRPSHIRLADRVLFLDNGALTMNGPPEEVLKRLPGGLA
ncbi:MAG: peptidase domain-containing ABC transporter [Alphaproteobacteria bacterium]|nr:peptidase domain-containing ABC transporter [Alphaproteobacteria bacterium]